MSVTAPRTVQPLSDWARLDPESIPCGHIIAERGVSWVDHSPCGRAASFLLKRGSIRLLLCRTHAKLKCYQPKP